MSLVNSFPGGNGGSEITVDSELSTTSENPVQNKVITTELNKKANSSSVPTQLSQLSADSTHRTVTDTEKSTWNGKQNAITAGEYLAFDGNTLNAQLPVVANQFEKSDLYSTTEKVVGCWTDGRPIYQKTFTGTFTLTANTEYAFVIATGIKNALKGSGFIKFSNNYEMTVPCDTSTNYSQLMKDPSGNLYLTVKGTSGGSTAYNVTIQYTKTTDAANSFKYADENDYSTTEHIVGSWIDGKPIYQKTIDFGVGPNKTTKSLAHGISNLKSVIDIKTIYNYKSSNYIYASSINSTDSHDGNSTYAVIDGDNIVVGSNANISTSDNSIYVTIKYTKTTD